MGQYIFCTKEKNGKMSNERILRNFHTILGSDCRGRGDVANFGGIQRKFFSLWRKEREVGWLVGQLSQPFYNVKARSLPRRRGWGFRSGQSSLHKARSCQAGRRERA